MSPEGLTRTQYTVFPLSESFAMVYSAGTGSIPPESSLVDLTGDIHGPAVDAGRSKSVLSHKVVRAAIVKDGVVWVYDDDGAQAYRMHPFERVDLPAPAVAFSLGGANPGTFLPDVLAEFASIRTRIWFGRTVNSHLKALDSYVY